ncbi:MAG: MFS transporter [archaeon]|nr:MFS transporter [archaeon]
MMIAESAKTMLYRYRWYVFLTLLCSYFFVYFHRMTVGILGGDIVSEVGGTVGILSSVYFWTYTAMQIPSGLLADHLGPRKASFIFMSLAALGSFLTAFGTEFWHIVLGKVFIAMGMAIVYIPLMKIISVWYRKSDFPQLNGLVIAVGNVGAIAASAPLEMLSDSIGGWRNVFIFLGILTMLLALLIVVFVRDHPHHKGLPGIDEIVSEETGEPVSDRTDARMPVLKGLRLVFSGGRRFWNMALAYFLVYGSIMVFQGTWAKYYFNNAYDFAYSVAWFITLIGVGKILSTITIGVLNGRGILRSKRRAMLFGTFLYLCIWAVLWLEAGQIDNYWFWMGICFLFGFFGGFMSLSFTQVKEWYPISIAGTAVSATNTFLFLGSSVCTTIAAAIMGSTYLLDDFRTLWMLMFVAAVLAFILVFFSLEKKPGDALVTE